MSDPAPIDVYFWPTPNGKKITLALEEMGLPYNLHPIDIGKGEQFAPEFLKISPNNRIPAIVDPSGPDGAPISVFESGAILIYLANKTGQFYGNTQRERLEALEWLMWQMSGLGPMSGQANHFRNYAPKMEPDPAKLAYGVDRYTKEVGRLYGVMNTRLADRDYLAGPYSIADMACWTWLQTPESFGQSLDDFPHVAAWRARIAERPAAQRALQIGVAARTTTLADTGPEADKARAILFGQGVPK